MKPNFNNIRRETVLALAYPFMWIVILVLWIIPISWRKKLTVFCGKKYYSMGHKARQYALDNLNKVYGAEKTPQEIEAMAQEVFMNIATAFIDYYATAYIKSRKRYFNMVEVTGEEYLRAAYEKGKGVICLIPHMSSWELSAVTPPMLGYSTCAASKAIKSWFVQKTMVWFRARRGMINISREGSYEKLVNVLKEGNCLILMIDQDTKVKGCFVDFFGHQAYTPTGAARLVMDTGAVVVPMAITHSEAGKYRFEICPELSFLSAGDEKTDLQVNTQAQTKAMEDLIKKTPSQWVWMHRRWKTTPESLAEVLRKRAASGRKTS
ncbi:MAG: lysophospholipid acyltransferase family protein [Prevotellaceae bacterium]|nr:lysophospholipid acyltransferase family protein [Prevotellaceae bacterium]